ncbi:MAG: hypothetical protein WCT19_02390 [Candidatus Paceibacterota bacterium]
MNYTPEQMREKLNALPENLREVILSLETAKTINSIGLRYRLNKEEIGILADKTGYMMLGFTRSNDFVESLMENLNLPEEIIKAVAAEINSKIFAQIQDSLKTIFSDPTLSSVPAAKPKPMDFPIEPVRSFPPEPKKQEPKPATGFFSEQNGNEFEPKPKPIERIYSAPKPPAPRPNPTLAPQPRPIQENIPKPVPVVPPPINLPTEPPARTAPPEFARQNNNSFQNNFKPSPATEYSHSDNLDRDSIIKDIENPNDIPMSPRTFSSSPEIPVSAVKTKAVEYDIPDTELPSGKPEASLPIPNIPKPQTFTPKPPSPPPIKTFPTEPQSIIEKKLQQTVSIPRKKSTYTIDPYREPLQ